MIPTSKDFQVQLDQLLQEASKQGRPHFDIEAASLHHMVWGYYGRKHRLPQCCYVMKKTMRHGDLVIKEADQDQGASLTIRYMLPR